MATKTDHRYYSDADIDLIIATCPDGLPEGPFPIQTADPRGTSPIIRNVDRRTALEGKLENAARWFANSRLWSEYDDAAPSKMRGQFQAIETSARKLLKSLGLPDTDAPYGPFAPADPNEIPLAVLYPLRKQAELTGQRIDGFPNHPRKDFITDGDSYTEYNGPAQLRDVIEGVKYLRDWSAVAKGNAAARVGSARKRHKGDEPRSNLIGGLVGIWVEVFGQSKRTSVGGPGTKFEGKATGPMVRYIQACLGPLNVSMTNDAVRAEIRKSKRLVKSGSK